jgi:hypothetical protein
MQMTSLRGCRIIFKGDAFSDAVVSSPGATEFHRIRSKECWPLDHRGRSVFLTLHSSLMLTWLRSWYSWRQEYAGWVGYGGVNFTPGFQKLVRSCCKDIQLQSLEDTVSFSFLTSEHNRLNLSTQISLSLTVLFFYLSEMRVCAGNQTLSPVINWKVFSCRSLIRRPQMDSLIVSRVWR